MTPALAIVEDHDIYRETVRTVVEASGEWGLCGTAASGEEALELFERAPCDLALVDLSLPGMSGFDLVRAARERWPAMRCLILSGHNQASYAAEALAAGASGYVIKGSPRSLRTAIAQVLDGQTYVSDSVRSASER